MRDTPRGLSHGRRFRNARTERTARVENAISGIAAESGFPRTDLAIKRGSALIWFANLLHGGSPRTDVALSRKS